MPGPLLLAALGGFFVLWYLAGNELMRRRAHRLALWCHEAAGPLGESPAIRWLTNGAFTIEVQRPAPPMQSASLTGLVESMDVAMLWLWHHLRGRRDMILLQLTLRRAPLWGVELYRPGSLVAGDARHRARGQGWQEQTLEEFQLAPAGTASEELARRLLASLGEERAGLLRLSIRPQGAQVLLALNLPRHPPEASLPPDAFAQTVRSLLQQMPAPSAPRGTT